MYAGASSYIAGVARKEQRSPASPSQPQIQQISVADSNRLANALKTSTTTMSSISPAAPANSATPTAVGVPRRSRHRRPGAPLIEPQASPLATFRELMLSQRDKTPHPLSLTPHYDHQQEMLMSSRFSSRMHSKEREEVAEALLESRPPWRPVNAADAKAQLAAGSQLRTLPEDSSGERSVRMQWALQAQKAIGGRPQWTVNNPHLAKEGIRADYYMYSQDSRTRRAEAEQLQARRIELLRAHRRLRFLHVSPEVAAQMTATANPTPAAGAAGAAGAAANNNNGNINGGGVSDMRPGSSEHGGASDAGASPVRLHQQGRNIGANSGNGSGSSSTSGGGSTLPSISSSSLSSSSSSSNPSSIPSSTGPPVILPSSSSYVRRASRSSASSTNELASTMYSSMSSASASTASGGVEGSGGVGMTNRSSPPGPNVGRMQQQQQYGQQQYQLG